MNLTDELQVTMGVYPAARPYYEQALAIWEQTLPPNHPNIQIVRRNLASLDS